MGAGVVLDSSVLIAAGRGDLVARRKLGTRMDERLAMSAITASELLHGVHRAHPPAVRARRDATVERAIEEIEVLAFDLVVARVHSRVWAALAAKGTIVGAHDLIIAATALAHGMSVATRDQRSFPKIPDLDVELWR